MQDKYLRDAIAIGSFAGQTNQGQNAIAIGNQAGATNQAANSIVLNAQTATVLNAATQGFYVAPIRATGSITNAALQWNSTTKEITVAGKTFIIDHPLDTENRHLIHGCLEGPEVGVYYRGTEVTVKDGDLYKAVVKLPDYTKSFREFTATATPVDVLCLHCVSKINSNNEFTITSDKPAEFNWCVIGKRGDVNVEPYKKDIVVSGEGPYKYYSNK